MQLEASDEVANWYGRQSILRNKFIDPSELEKNLRKLTAKDIRQAAQQIMKENGLNLAVIGPVKTAEKMRLQKMLKL